MNWMMKTVTQLLVLLALTACVANTAPTVPLAQKLQDQGYRVGAEVKRVSNFRLNGWSEVDDRHIMMTSGVSQRYLVSLRSRCFNLAGAQTIAYTTTVGSLTVSDSILVKDFSRIAERCPIQSIFQLEAIR